MANPILIARIGAPHGVRGEVRLFAFGSDPEALRDYALTDPAGRPVRITHLRAATDHFVARIAGIADRNAAEALTNTDLFVDRDALPEAEDEDTFYHADLIGLAVEDPSGAPLGTVTALHDFGAGDILEYAPLAGGPSRLVAFTKAAVPVVDIAGRRVVVAPPPEIEARGAAGDAPGASDAE
ncbi:ribosome maturation factor RimM [Aquabacter spiritensis]|uniref:Ribosome maturation factor RimM n=1 Tax=Aquabacter spiritensis TaxID=933073 RepID=A0A4R3M5F9_9HYPH|nr:ribosome maturation factor RimM [Aquabacter spiritensis]TCT08136.1 16S rRNA processing protein RimM [Aquabacter spiritensis]